METTIKSPRWRFSLIAIVAVVTLFCIGMAIVVSGGRRSQSFAVLRAPAALAEAQDLFVSSLAVRRSIPMRFADVDASAFLDEHFEIRRSATMRDVADGMPAVLVRTKSQWLLSDPSTTRELARLNAELARFCREMLDGKPAP